jgi:hypothetical protein
MGWWDEQPDQRPNAVNVALNSPLGQECLAYAAGDREFAAWLLVADSAWSDRPVWSIFDLGDGKWREAFDAGRTPEAALREAVQGVGEWRSPVQRAGTLVNPLNPPTHVGDLRWPVMSAVRVGSAEDPAALVVIVDCGEPTPREPYATFRVLQLPHRSKAEQGEYDLTLAQAQRSLAERAGLLPTTEVEVVVVRDPDEANAYAVFVDGQLRPDGKTERVRVVTQDIDLGAVTVTPAWVAEQLQRATRTLSPAAADHAREAVTTYAHAEDQDLEVRN